MAWSLLTREPVYVETDMPDDPGVVCSVDEPKLVARHEIRVNCTEPAVWVGVPPCGHEGFFCEKHHSDTRSFQCRTCGNTTLLAVYEWTRL
jgi:hypothetical protein